MKIDEIHYKRISFLQNEIISYINESYLKEINSKYMDELIFLLDKWDENRDMIDRIVMGLSIEGKLNIEEIDKKRLDLAISKVLFEKYVYEVLNNSNLERLNIVSCINISEIKLKIILKEYLYKNVREIFNKRMESLNDISIYISEDFKVSFKRQLKII